MANLTAILIAVTLTAQAMCAPQIKKQTSNPVTLKAPVNFTVDELKYILTVRSGVKANSPKTMTPCARAILSCCNGSVMNESCSENMQCGAYFFDANPCEEQFIVAALNAARSFYEQFNQV